MNVLRATVTGGVGYQVFSATVGPHCLSGRATSQFCDTQWAAVPLSSEVVTGHVSQWQKAESRCLTRYAELVSDMDGQIRCPKRRVTARGERHDGMVVDLSLGRAFRSVSRCMQGDSEHKVVKGACGIGGTRVPTRLSMLASWTMRTDALAAAAAVETGGGDAGNDDAGGHGGGGWGKGGHGDGAGGSGGEQPGDGESSSNEEGGSGIPFLGALAQGWRSRVDADPEFIFKVLTEQVLGVGACVLGDMSTRPNFGLNELDFVFATLVVGSILNFALMYCLAPTGAAAGSDLLPWVFRSCPNGHMFQPGPYSLVQRAGTFVYKGAHFACIGFGAGLVGTTMSNILISIRKRCDPAFKVQNAPPPTLLNAATWGLHMGISSNVRYQMLNGLEDVLVKMLPPTTFKGLVFLVRTANNVVGGASFVILAKITGAQKAAASSPPIARDDNDTKAAVRPALCVSKN